MESCVARHFPNSKVIPPRPVDGVLEVFFVPRPMYKVRGFHHMKC
jgi:hypothetical protein